jgi:hypothetical protein
MLAVWFSRRLVDFCAYRRIVIVHRFAPTARLQRWVFCRYGLETQPSRPESPLFAALSTSARESAPAVVVNGSGRCTKAEIASPRVIIGSNLAVNTVVSKDAIFTMLQMTTTTRIVVLTLTEQTGVNGSARQYWIGAEMTLHSSIEYVRQFCTSGMTHEEAADIIDLTSQLTLQSPLHTQSVLEP